MSDVQDPFDTLLARMPAIAKAVAAFPEAVQTEAFAALMAAADGSSASVRQDAAQGPPSNTKKRRSRTPLPSADNGRSKRTASTTLREDKDLDLSPKGKDSWEVFAAAKKPTNNHDKHAVAVYYLTHVAALNPVTLQQVYTAWRRIGWRLPTTAFAQSLRLTASRKNFIDTGDSSDLRIRHAGVNRVEHELPVQAKS